MQRSVKTILIVASHPFQFSNRNTFLQISSSLSICFHKIRFNTKLGMHFFTFVDVAMWHCLFQSFNLCGGCQIIDLSTFSIDNEFKIFCVLKVPHPERINKIGHVSYGPLREGSQVCPSILIGVCDPFLSSSTGLFIILNFSYLVFYILYCLQSICNNPWYVNYIIHELSHSF